jgi:serine/threonine protein kinase, bacterial
MLLNDRYLLVRQLRKGGCAATSLAEDQYLPSRRKCVIKQFKPSNGNATASLEIRAKFKKEAEVLEILGKHELIPELYAVFEENAELYIVQEWIDGLTLTDKIMLDGALDADFVRDFLVCVLSVLEFVHSNNIIHRDIKPENIILRESDGMPVLIDFGVIKDLDETIIANHSNSCGTSVGSRGYSSPEQFAGHTTYSNDLFSLGMVAIFLLTGKNPTTFIDEVSGIVRWWPTIKNWEHIDKHLFNTLNKAVKSSAKERFSSAREMKNSLYNSTPRHCAIFAAHIHTPFMWKLRGDFRSELVVSDYDESMKLHSEDSGIFQRGKHWTIDRRISAKLSQ